VSRHRLCRPAPTAGKPLTLREHFFWTVIAAVTVVTAVLAPAYVADANTSPKVVSPDAPPHVQQQEVEMMLSAPMQPLTVGQDQHSAFPGLVGPLPGSGELQLVWREGTNHVDERDGDLLRAVSRDGGLTYGETTVLRSGADFRDPSISFVNGALAMTMFTGTHTQPAQGAWAVREWGLYSRIDTLPYAAITAPLVTLPDGRLGAAFYGRKAGELIDTAWMGWSSDDGRTWVTNRIANSIGAGIAHNEPWLVVDGSQIHFFYRWGSADGIGMRTSPDSGVTWGPPRKILNNASGRPTVLRTSAGTLLMVYRSLPSKDAVLAYSDDHGVTWQSGGTVLAAPAGSPLGMTYAAMAEIEEGGVVHLVVGMEQAPVGGGDATSRLYGGWLNTP
jgi:hypothetical protein